jgi:DNA-binding NarL/FixJ family response regulator
MVIMDVAMPGMNGVEATHHILSMLPKTKILALSMYGDRRYVLNMFQAGVSGYMLKACAYEELFQAIRQIMAGKRYISPDLSEIFIQGYQGGFYSRNIAFSLLTAREREVLKLIADGKSTAQIAEYLSISGKTGVAKHRRADKVCFTRGPHHLVDVKPLNNNLPLADIFNRLLYQADILNFLLTCPQ